MGLTAPGGPFQVSSITLEIPVRNPRSFAENQFRLNGKPALNLQTVLFNVYYPSQSHREGGKARKTEGAFWLNSPRFRSVEGLLKYAGISKYWAPAAILPAAGLFFSRLPFPQAQPLASKPNKFPVAVFSHGLGGTRTFYSQYCASLASNGLVCFAIEHRDASGPHSSIYKPKPDTNSPSDPIYDSLTYFRFSELDNQSVHDAANADDRPETGSSNSTPPDEWEFRRAQIEFRNAEIMEVVHILKELEDGKGEEVMKKSTRSLDGNPKSKHWSNEEDINVLKDFEKNLDVDNLWSLGHSFGSATMISLLRSFSESSESNPFRQSLLLDPWLEPFYRSSSDSHFGSRSQPSLKTPLFVINSQGFTVWRDHFPILKDYVQESKRNSGRGFLVTLTGSGHTDFSDFPYTLPRVFKSKIEVERAMEVFSKITLLQIFGKGEVENGKKEDEDGISNQVISHEELEHLSYSLKEINVTVREEMEGEVRNKDLGEPGVLIIHPLSRL